MHVFKTDGIDNLEIRFKINQKHHCNKMGVYKPPELNKQNKFTPYEFFNKSMIEFLFKFSSYISGCLLFISSIIVLYQDITTHRLYIKNYHSITKLFMLDMWLDDIGASAIIWLPCTPQTNITPDLQNAIHNKEPINQVLVL